ncbi:N-6 DNA methylase [Candidatus Peregrinibacteria bacterium]|nr:N-6 DNA methylase [Candidatus Peregrinibacteria bacterium]
MASIFKQKKLKEELEKFEILEFEQKLEIVKKWHKAYEDGSLQKKSEKEVEQEFIQSFFVDILGYTRFPENPHTIIPQGKVQKAGGQKPDAILGCFEEDKKIKRVSAVCEIKDANTPLDKSQQRAGSMTPVQQAFKYKYQYDRCDFVIATNFFEIRLLQDTELHYEKWTLKTLVDEKNDYFDFKKFYYLLCEKNFVAKTGQSRTEKLLSEIRIEEEAITKKFYGEYKSLRLSLIGNILANNEEFLGENALDIAIEKAQKIIDRIVFVCFCEDLDLLPQHKLKEVVNHTEKVGLALPIWDIMKGFFNAIDRGSEKLEIPHGFNGELFKQDPLLEGLRIDDELCKRFVDLGKYDFSEDLTVNILGHIFEQSISDIEDLKALDDVEELTKKKSKRKKEGIFYTPEYIVDYIVKNSVGTWLKEREKELLKKHGVKEGIEDKNYKKRYQAAYEEYQGVLQNIKVLDPACGSGAFLVKVFDYLLEENKRVGEILGNIFSDEGYIKDILQNNIYGVDLNEESVEITKLSLWLKTAEKGKKLTTLKENIKCGNSLIDDVEVAGDKAFIWEKEFKEIMEAGGFDVIVGNPPYVRQELLNSKIKEFLNVKYDNVGSFTADLYVYFFGLSLRLLNSKGFLGFIAPNKWMERKYGFNMRCYIKNYNIIYIVNYGELKIFEDASTEPAIYIIKNIESQDDINYSRLENLALAQATANYHYEKYKKFNLDDKIWRFIPKENQVILNKFLKSNKKISTIGDYTKGGIKYGIKTGYNTAFIIKEEQKELLIENDIKSSEIIKPMVEGDDFSDWHLIKQDKYMLATGYDLDIPSVYPAIYEYLKSYEEKLINRYDKGVNYWNLRACDYYDLLEKPKIIFYHTAKHHSFYYDEEGLYISANCYFITNVDRYLQCFLNSKLFQFVKRYLFPSFGDPEKGGRMRLDANQMRKVPIVIPEANQKDEFHKLAEKISKFSTERQSVLDKFDKLLKQEYSFKFKSSHIYNWDKFIEEFKKQKIKLSLSQKDELLQIFEKYQKEIFDFDNKIKAIEEQINNEVFDLYDLTDDERRIVLNF